MSIRTATLGAALLAAAWLPAAAPAQAQEIILYDGPNYTGQQVRVTGADRNLSSRRFNDRTSSFRIVSGEWEVCQHDDYNGTCETHRSDQPSLGRMDNQITSVRPAYLGRPDPGYPGRPGRPGESSITLYSGYNYTGRSVTITDTVSNLQQLGFNDQARSIRHSGRRSWRVCQHANFDGACMEVDRDIPSIGGGMAAQISSVEPDYGSRPGRPGHPGRPGSDNRPRSGVFLYDGPNFTGQRVDVSWDVTNLASQGFNDRADSLVVARGETWLICQHDDFGGRCERVQGEVSDLGRYGLRNEITSLRRIDNGYGGGGGWDNGGYPGGGGWDRRGEIILYDQFSQRGRSVRIEDEIDNLERLGFNDRALSLDVRGYDRWLVCEDAGFRGRCEEVSGEVDNLHLLNREISSVRRLGRY